MSSPFIGQIMLVPYTFAPRNWANCDGQLLSISQYSALFSLLGTTYGGDGRTTFGLPDLRSRVAIHTGTGPGLSTRTMGSRGGVEQVVLTETQIPSHDHVATATSIASAVAPAGNSNDAVGNFWADDAGVSSGTYHSGPANSQMNAGAITTNITVNNAGGNQSHTNVQPFLTLRYVIALLGVYPSRS